MQKRMAAILSACMAFFFLTVSVQAAETGEGLSPRSVEESVHELPVRIALVPLLDRKSAGISLSEKEEILERLQREIHIPLNHTMQWAEYIPPDEVASAFADIGGYDSRKKEVPESVRRLADILSADVAVYLIVNEHYQHEFISFDWERSLMIESVAALTLYVYDKKTDTMIKKNARRWVRDEYNPSYEVQVLTMDALEQVLQEADIRSYIFPISKERRNIVGKAADVGK